MRAFLLIFALLSPLAAQNHPNPHLNPKGASQTRVGFAGGMPINMGHRFPQVGGIVSWETPRIRLYANALLANKIDGGWGVSGLNSAQFCLKRVDVGARHSWLIVQNYRKHAVRPFVQLGQHDLNVKYVWWGTDRQNKLQAVLGEWRIPVDAKSRFSMEAGPTFFHATNLPGKRHVGFVMVFAWEVRR